MVLFGGTAIQLHTIIFGLSLLTLQNLLNTANGQTLVRHVVSNQSQALCNDGSPAIYYLHQVHDARKWLIFLEGGGGCNSEHDCRKRYQKTPYFMSSKGYPSTTVARTLLADPEMTDYNKVVVVYCSSDLWLGNDSPKKGTNSRNNDNEGKGKSNDDDNISYNNKTNTNDTESTNDDKERRSNDKLKLNNTINNNNNTFNNNNNNNNNNTGKSPTPFVFRGAVIFSTILMELLSHRGLNNATEVILAGQSAGGVGVLNHLQFVSSVLPRNCKLSSILDSAWFINFEDYFTIGKDSEGLAFAKATGLLQRPSCRDTSLGFPCCYSAFCLTANSYLPPDVPIFLLQSKYDIYVMFQRLLEQNLHLDNVLESTDILLKVHAYGGRMQQSLDMVLGSHPSLSYVFTSCFQHGYLMSSDLWRSVYKSTIELVFPSVRFMHSLNASHWSNINIGGVSLRDLLMRWKRSRYVNDSTTAAPGGMNNNFRTDDLCAHAQCNPTCPQLIHFDKYSSSWSFWKKVSLIALILFITVGCLLTKCLWVMQHRNLKKTQALYLNLSYHAHGGEATPEGGKRGIDEERQRVFDKVMCLPTCPPHSAIGISCSDLEYDIGNLPYVGGSDTGTLIRKRSGGGNSVASASDNINLKVRKRSTYMGNKKIIKGITAYFNPGQLVAIMGPSGSGKTTLLDVITARKHLKEAEENIFINGLPADETREWFIKNSGYVLQLATPYHEELTVRQNLTYSAMMRLPMKMKVRDKIWRVEQVLGQCGLYGVADVVVGDNSPTGGGLSGGQKRRLCIALQLLDLPSVIFLDEPTSGLDSASSLELLETLHGLTLSGRLVVVTIHQPRIEIFHMFDAILLLSEGQVAYFGSPIVAPAMIAQALEGSGQKFDASNPADSIMDVLTNPDSQKIILDYYLQSGEIQAINRAIARARRHPQKTLSMKFQKQTSSIQNRLLALDGRSSASQTMSQMFYFPLIYLLYGLALGTCYWKTEKGILLMSCYMVFSCASQLFLASVIHGHLHKAFALFELEKADGVGHSTELVLHVFIRTFSESAVPLVVSCAIIYLSTIKEYVLWKFCLTTLIHLQLNQAWIAIIIFTACMTPRFSSLVTPLLSAVSGFAGGFLVPAPQMPFIYSWLFYINPTHWAYSGMMKVLITDETFECKWDSPLECQTTTGIVVLSEFGFSKRNPYASMLVLLSMLVLFFILSVVVLEVKYSRRKWDKRKKSYWHAVRQSITSVCGSLMENYNRKKREAEEEEKRRLLKLVEHEYRYKSDTYDSASNTLTTPTQKEKQHLQQQQHQQATKCYEPLKDHSQDTVLEDGGLMAMTTRKGRSDTIYSVDDFGDETYGETENSSNDEDIDPTVEQQHVKKKHSRVFQQNSINSIFAKLQSGLSRSPSIDTNGNQLMLLGGGGPEEGGDESVSDETAVHLRSGNKKKRNWRKAFAQRRKTFTGFTIAEEGGGGGEKNDINGPKYNQFQMRARPKSMLLPSDRHSDYFLRLSRTRSVAGYRDSTTNTPRASRNNTFSSSSVTTVIEHQPAQTPEQYREARVSIVRKRPQPRPDIILDIEEGPIIEESKQALMLNNPPPSPNIFQYSAGVGKVPEHKPTNTKSRVRHHHHRKRKKKDPKAKDTWSKYLDVNPKRHEVYCALNSIKKRLRGSGRGVRGALKKSESVHLQRNASMLILDEKKDSMRNQLSGLRRTYTDEYADESYSPSTMKRIVLLKARNKYLNRGANDHEHQQGDTTAPLMTSEPSGVAVGEEIQVVPRSPKRRLTGDRALLERLSALSSHRSSARSSMGGNTISSKRSSKSNSSYMNLDNNSSDLVNSLVALGVSAATSSNDPATSAELYNVLRKLHDSIDQLECEDIDPMQGARGCFGGAAVGDIVKRDEEDTHEPPEKHHRLSDPFLPEERDLVESLLLKYGHLEKQNETSAEPHARALENNLNEDRLVFSSKVKIRGTSPHHSRRGSVKRTASKSTLDSLNFVPASASAENNSDTINEEEIPLPTPASPVKHDTTFFDSDALFGNALTNASDQNYDRQTQQQQRQNKAKAKNVLPSTLLKNDRLDHVKETVVDTSSKTSTPSTTPKNGGTPRTRKVSTVREFAMRFEAAQQQQQQHQQYRQQHHHHQQQKRFLEPKFTIIPEPKSYQLSSSSSSADSSDSDIGSSSGSEYDDTMIVKTNEGFIIPNEAIDKLPMIGKATKAQRLREEQEEIERQFKKENFLKDLPTSRRGIKMPTGSAGKVNQLKSKFEGAANPTITQRLRRGSLKSSSLFGGNSSNHQQNSASHNHVSKKEAPSANQAVASNNTTNITNTTTTATTTTSSSKQRTFFKKRRQISSRSTDSDSEGTVEINPVSNRFYDDGNVDSVDNFYCFDQKSISSERDLLYTYSRGELDNQLSPQYSQGDLWSTDDDDGGDDVISIQSFNSDRKRKRVYTRIINNKTRDDLEQFV